MPPETSIWLSNVRVTVPDAVALALSVAVHVPPTEAADTTVVPAGMPVPETATPGPMAAMVVAKVTVGKPLVVVPDAVKTPTGSTVVPVKGPNSGRVLTLDEMSLRFCPGCAIRLLAPLPYAS